MYLLLFTWLQLHEEHDVEALPDGPKELHHPGGVESAPRAHLPAAEVTEWDLRGPPCHVLRSGGHLDS